jgi:hypothetical protein
MAGTRKSPRSKGKDKTNPTPPGATKAASDHDLRPGEPADRTPSGEEAVGTPGDGTEVGGLAGTNIDDGDPVFTNLDRAMGSDARGEDSEEGGPPYAGHSGGAVGGTPAQRRAAGGHETHGIAPQTGTPSDSTIGHDPKPRKKRKG